MTATLITAPDAAWALVERAKAGDREAFAEIYRRYEPMVGAWLYTLTGDLQLTRDLTADVFVKALTNIGRVEWQGKDIGAWLRTIARNRLTDHYRRETRHRAALVDSAPLVDSIYGWAIAERLAGDWADDTPRSDPADAVAAQVAAKAVLAAIRGLRPDFRQVIVLRYLNDLTLDETSEVMGRSKPAIKSLQHRALEELRRNETVAALAVAA